MNEATTMQEIDGVLAAIWTYTGYFPRDAIQRAIELDESLRPHLVAILNEVVAKAASKIKDSKIADEDWQAFTIALHVLAKLRAKEAFKPLIAACYLSRDRVDELFGEAVPDGLAQYLGSTFDGDFEALRQVVFDDSIDGIVRNAAIRTYLVLYRNEAVSRDTVIAAFKQFFAHFRNDDSDVALTNLVNDSVDIHAAELLPEIRDAFASGNVDDTWVDLEYAEHSLAGGGEEVLQRFRDDCLYQFIADPIKEMEWWACWKDHEDRRQEVINESKVPQPKPTPQSNASFYSGFEPYRNENRNVGRNDQCPCGSGKKYKKCCLGKAEARANPKHQRLESELEQTIDRLLQDGYRHQNDSAKACDIWSEAWEMLKPHLTPEMRSPVAVDEIFDGSQFFSNWAHDFEIELLNAAMHDKGYAHRGIAFIKEYLDQFPDESLINVRSLSGDLAQMYYLAGDQVEGERLARSMIDKWPNAAAGYVTMAQLAERRIETEKAGAMKAQLEWLEKAQAAQVVDGADYDLEQRIQDVNAELGV